MSDWQLSIPKIGTIKAKSKPFVVLTPNEVRRISDPLRRLEVYIYGSNTQRSSERPRSWKSERLIHMRAYMAGPHRLRARTSRLHPGKGAIDRFNARPRRGGHKSLGVREISADLRDVLLPLIAKTQNDRKRLLLRDGFESLVYDTQQYSRDGGQAALEQKELVCAERRRY